MKYQVCKTAGLEPYLGYSSGIIHPNLVLRETSKACVIEIADVDHEWQVGRLWSGLMTLSIFAPDPNNYTREEAIAACDRLNAGEVG